ncbi:TPA: hypothetical protein ACTUT5_003901 [Legionella anisa]
MHAIQLNKNHGGPLQGIHYYMTYGFYNPALSQYVLRDAAQQPKNYFRVLGYEHCAFGIGLDQMYFTSEFSIAHIGVRSCLFPFLYKSHIGVRSCLFPFLYK